MWLGARGKSHDRALLRSHRRPGFDRAHFHLAPCGVDFRLTAATDTDTDARAQSRAFSFVDGPVPRIIRPVTAFMGNPHHGCPDAASPAHGPLITFSRIPLFAVLAGPPLSRRY